LSSGDGPKLPPDLGSKLLGDEEFQALPEVKNARDAYRDAQRKYIQTMLKVHQARSAAATNAPAQPLSATTKKP
jgi:hypothetical protein